MLSAGDIDHMDPGAAYYQFTYMVTRRPSGACSGWQPDDDETPTPDLADGRADGLERQQDDHLQDPERDQVQPATGRWNGAQGDVTSADVKYAIERGSCPAWRTATRPCTSATSTGFKQAQAAAAKDPTKAPNISGIETPDDQTIVFHLDQADRSPP